MVAQKRTTRNEHKRHGRHQKQSKHFMRVYAPYMPLLVIVGLGLIFSSVWQPHSPRGVLAYATSMSRSDLLASTNTQRSSYGQSTLSLNDQLNQAAQAKANDMVARDYWSHNTPDGQAPWVFIENTGYQYQKAGENLAYGFLTSNDAVIGWMNSQAHKENLLDSAFEEVGFGFANSVNFNETGPETVVVAMYGDVLAASSPAPAQTAPASSSSTPVVQAAPIKASQAAPSEAQTVTEPAAEPVSETPKKSESQPVTTQHNPIEEQAAKSISKIAALTGGKTAWLASTASMLIVAGLGVLLIKHGLAFKRLISKGERFVLHHALFDITIVGLIGLCVIVTRTAGVVR